MIIGSEKDRKRVLLVDGLTSYEVESNDYSNSYQSVIFFTDNKNGHGDIYKGGYLYTQISDIDYNINKFTSYQSTVALTRDAETHMLELTSLTVNPTDVTVDLWDNTSRLTSKTVDVTAYINRTQEDTDFEFLCDYSDEIVVDEQVHDDNITYCTAHIQLSQSLFDNSHTCISNFTTPITCVAKNRNVKYVATTNLHIVQTNILNEPTDIHPYQTYNYVFEGDYIYLGAYVTYNGDNNFIGLDDSKITFTIEDTDEYAAAYYGHMSSSFTNNKFVANYANDKLHQNAVATVGTVPVKISDGYGHDTHCYVNVSYDCIPNTELMFSNTTIKLGTNKSEQTGYTYLNIYPQQVKDWVTSNNDIKYSLTNDTYNLVWVKSAKSFDNGTTYCISIDSNYTGDVSYDTTLTATFAYRGVEYSATLPIQYRKSLTSYATKLDLTLSPSTAWSYNFGDNANTQDIIVAYLDIQPWNIDTDVINLTSVNSLVKLSDSDSFTVENVTVGDNSEILLSKPVIVKDHLINNITDTVTASAPKTKTTNITSSKVLKIKSDRRPIAKNINVKSISYTAGMEEIETKHKVYENTITVSARPYTSYIDIFVDGKDNEGRMANSFNGQYENYNEEIFGYICYTYYTSPKGSEQYKTLDGSFTNIVATNYFIDNDTVTVDESNTYIAYSFNTRLDTPEYKHTLDFKVRDAKTNAVYATDTATINVNDIEKAVEEIHLYWRRNDTGKLEEITDDFDSTCIMECTRGTIEIGLTNSIGVESTFVTMMNYSFVDAQDIDVVPAFTYTAAGNSPEKYGWKGNANNNNIVKFELTGDKDYTLKFKVSAKTKTQSEACTKEVTLTVKEFDLPQFTVVGSTHNYNGGSVTDTTTATLYYTYPNTDNYDSNYVQLKSYKYAKYNERYVRDEYTKGSLGELTQTLKIEPYNVLNINEICNYRDLTSQYAFNVDCTEDGIYTIKFAYVATNDLSETLVREMQTSGINYTLTLMKSHIAKTIFKQINVCCDTIYANSISELDVVPQKITVGQNINAITGYISKQVDGKNVIINTVQNVTLDVDIDEGDATNMNLTVPATGTPYFSEHSYLTYADAATTGDISDKVSYKFTMTVHPVGDGDEQTCVNYAYIYPNHIDNFTLYSQSYTSYINDHYAMSFEVQPSPQGFDYNLTYDTTKLNTNNGKFNIDITGNTTDYVGKYEIKGTAKSTINPDIDTITTVNSYYVTVCYHPTSISINENKYNGNEFNHCVYMAKNTYCDIYTTLYPNYNEIDLTYINTAIDLSTPSKISSIDFPIAYYTVSDVNNSYQYHVVKLMTHSSDVNSNTSASSQYQTYYINSDDKFVVTQNTDDYCVSTDVTTYIRQFGNLYAKVNVPPYKGENITYMWLSRFNDEDHTLSTSIGIDNNLCWGDYGEQMYVNANSNNKVNITYKNINPANMENKYSNDMITYIYTDVINENTNVTLNFISTYIETQTQRKYNDIARKDIDLLIEPVCFKTANMYAQTDEDTSSYKGHYPITNEQLSKTSKWKAAYLNTTYTQTYMAIELNTIPMHNITNQYNIQEICNQIYIKRTLNGVDITDMTNTSFYVADHKYLAKDANIEMTSKTNMAYILPYSPIKISKEETFVAYLFKQYRNDAINANNTQISYSNIMSTVNIDGTINADLTYVRPFGHMNNDYCDVMEMTNNSGIPKIDTMQVDFATIGQNVSTTAGTSTVNVLLYIKNNITDEILKNGLNALFDNLMLNDKFEVISDNNQYLYIPFTFEFVYAQDTSNTITINADLEIDITNGNISLENITPNTGIKTLTLANNNYTINSDDIKEIFGDTISDVTASFAMHIQLQGKGSALIIPKSISFDKPYVKTKAEEKLNLSDTRYYIANTKIVEITLNSSMPTFNFESNDENIHD